MMAKILEPSLIDRLPAVRGRLSENAPLAPAAWFRVGGPAAILFRPADVEDLAQFIAAKPADVPLTTIGVASNLLIRDGGIAGVTVRLGGNFAGIKIDGELIEVGAGALDATLARTAAEAGLGGLEFLSGIPGSIGGALRMNAGAYGREISDVLVSVTAIDGAGIRHVLPAESLGLSYRHCSLPDDMVLVAATLRGQPEDPNIVTARMAEIQAKRQASQPIRARTGGSTFANPPGEKAWALIDRAGCRGLTRGGAQVSELHTNFLINQGGASAADIEGLGEEVRRRVFDISGISLEWEIKRIGLPIWNVHA